MKFLVAFSAVVAMVYADADPYLLGYGGYGIGYAGLKSAPCVNAANVPVPCNVHYGKREAEAEPYLDTDSDTPELDTLELDSRALPVSTLPMSPCLVLLDLDLSTTERGKPRLSLSTDTDTLVSDMLVSDTDTESTPAMSVCAPTISELLYLAKKLRNLQEIFFGDVGILLKRV